MNKRQQLERELELFIYEVLQRDDNVLGSVLIDLKHQVKIRVEDPKFDIWDDDAIDHIQTILSNSLRSNAHEIMITYDELSYYVQIQIVDAQTFWIFRNRLRGTKMPSYLLPYDKWRQQVRDILAQF